MRKALSSLSVLCAIARGEYHTCSVQWTVLLLLRVVGGVKVDFCTLKPAAVVHLDSAPFLRSAARAGDKRKHACERQLNSQQRKRQAGSDVHGRCGHTHGTCAVCTRHPSPHAPAENPMATPRRERASRESVSKPVRAIPVGAIATHLLVALAQRTLLKQRLRLRRRRSNGACLCCRRFTLLRLAAHIQTQTARREDAGNRTTSRLDAVSFPRSPRTFPAF